MGFKGLRLPADQAPQLVDGMMDGKCFIKKKGATRYRITP